MRYWEDFPVGSEAEHGTVEVTEEDVVRFAREFDPQPFHTDPEAAAAGPFGGLIASGWHTAALYMGVFVRSQLLDSASMGSPGVEELRWLAPVRPGDVLTARSRVVEAWPSETNPRRGTIVGEHEFVNQRGEVVMRTRPRACGAASRLRRVASASMRTRSLGEGGPEVSVVGLGTNNFGGRCDYEQSRAVVDAALDAGVTLIDTADIYSQGRSEDFIGRALAGRRDQVLIATKFGKPMDERPEESRGRPEYVRWAVEGSLRRLQTDTIDVLQMHEPDPSTPIEETLGVLDELVREGKVRWIGSSNFSAEQIDEADRIARERGLARFVSAQNHYSLVERGIEDDVLPACERLGIGQLPYFPLASGLLTGKYTRGVEATEGRLAGREIPEERWDRAEALQRYADERGVSLLDVAVGGLLAMPAVASVIAGATKPEQVRANVAAGAWEPSAEDVAALAALR